MGGLVRQPQLARSAGCCSRATRTATCASGAATPGDAAARGALRGARAPRRRGCDQRRARRRLGLPAAWSGAARGAGRARRGALRPRARPALAAHVVQRHHAPARTRPRVAQRAGGGACVDRRAGGRGAAGRAAAAATRRRAAPSLLAEMPVGARGRHVRAPRARGDRLRRRRPRRRARRADRASVQARRAVEIGDPAVVVAGPARGDRDAARPLPAACGCATSRARDRLDELEFELPLVGGDDADRPARRSTRSRAVLREHLPAGDPLAGYADRLADPALRTRGARLPDRQHRPRRPRAGRRASRSSTTRRTGSPAPARS